MECLWKPLIYDSYQMLKKVGGEMVKLQVLIVW